MSSLQRLVGILDCVAAGNGVMSAEELAERFGYTRSTTYRHLKVLTDAGLLTSWHGDGFALGPRIIELSAGVLARDPLVLASKGVMHQLMQRFEGVSLLCRRFRDRLVCVHREAGDNSYLPNYGVGDSLPLEGSAAAQAMISFYSPQKLRKHYQEHAAMYAQNGLGNDLQQVRARLKFVRELGYASRVVPGDVPTILISSPVLDSQRKPIASLTLAIGAERASETLLPGVAEQVVATARSISAAIAP